MELVLTFDWDDELRNDGQDFVTTVFEHVVDSLSGEEFEWMFRFTETIEEERQIVVVV